MGNVSRWILAAMLLSAACSAKATLITWTLQNLTFHEGGAASGFFTLDSSNINHPINFEIKSTVGTSITSTFVSPFEYTPANSTTTNFLSGSTLDALQFHTLADDPNFPSCSLVNCGHVLTLNFYDSLTGKRGLPALGGTVSLIKNGASVFSGANSWEQFPGESFRYGTSGSLNGIVPEPSLLAFFSVAVGLVAYLRKRGI